MWGFIGILVTYAVVQFIQSYILEPLVVGAEVNINPLFTILALVAGELISSLSQEKWVNIFPVDSEHSAIFQCLVGEFHNKIEKIILTASGGPFRGRDRTFLETVTKADAEGEWQQLKPAILGVIMEHYLSGAPVVLDEKTEDRDGSEFFSEEDGQIVTTIKELLDTRVRPAVAQDGGDITFHGYRDGVVFLNMRGACAGCPSSTATLKHGIENLLRHFVPEVSEVRPV